MVLYDATSDIQISGGKGSAQQQLIDELERQTRGFISSKRMFASPSFFTMPDAMKGTAINGSATVDSVK